MEVIQSNLVGITLRDAFEAANQDCRTVKNQCWLSNLVPSDFLEICVLIFIPLGICSEGQCIYDQNVIYFNRTKSAKENHWSLHSSPLVAGFLTWWWVDMFHCVILDQHFLHFFLFDHPKNTKSKEASFGLRTHLICLYTKKTERPCDDKNTWLILLLMRKYFPCWLIFLPRKIPQQNIQLSWPMHFGSIRQVFYV